MLCVPVASRATGQVVALACAFNKQGGQRYVCMLRTVFTLKAIINLFVIKITLNHFMSSYGKNKKM